MFRLGHSLDTLVDCAQNLTELQKEDLSIGDIVVVKTYNSLYQLEALRGGYFIVRGGWFDSRGESPARLKVTGCTWGGSIVKLDIVAALGLCLEFENRVVTSPIRQIWFFPIEQRN